MGRPYLYVSIQVLAFGALTAAAVFFIGFAVQTFINVDVNRGAGYLFQAFVAAAAGAALLAIVDIRERLEDRK